MTEKRKHKRYPKRFKVRYGETAFTHTGFTHDLSASGLFVLAHPAPKIGTQLHLEVFTEGNKSVFFEAVVRRAVVAEPQLRTVVKTGFGVRFLSPGELFAQLVPQAEKDAELLLQYQSASEFAAAYDKELRHGGAVVRSRRKFPLQAPVAIRIQLTHSGASALFAAQVVHLTELGGGEFGVAVAFLDRERAVAELSAQLPPAGA